MVNLNRIINDIEINKFPRISGKYESLFVYLNCNIELFYIIKRESRINIFKKYG
jgi:hypothetical protein